MEDNIKKIEIVTDMAYLKKLLSLFEQNEIHGYTIIKDVTGKGKRGNKDGHGMMAGFKNCYVFIFAEEDEAKVIVKVSLKECSRATSAIALKRAHL